jgi:hypothetical protein
VREAFACAAGGELSHVGRLPSCAAGAVIPRLTTRAMLRMCGPLEGACLSRNFVCARVPKRARKAGTWRAGFSLFR